MLKVRNVLKRWFIIISVILLPCAIVLISSYGFIYEEALITLNGETRFEKLLSFFFDYYFKNEFAIGANNHEYKSAFLSTIVAIDGIILTLGIQFSLDRIRKIKDHYNNSYIIKKIIDADMLIKSLPYFLVIHLFFTLVLFFSSQKEGYLFVIFCIIVTLSLYILILYLFEYFNKIEKYQYFDNLNINNPVIHKLLKNWHKDKKCFNELTSLLRDIILASHDNILDFRTVKYLNNITYMYIKIHKNLNNKNYQDIFISDAGNGFLYFRHLIIIFHAIDKIYEQNSKKNNYLILTSLLQCVVNILIKSNTRGFNIGKLEYYQHTSTSRILQSVETIVKYNILEPNIIDLNDDNNVIWIFRIISQDVYLDQDVFYSKLLETFKNICYFAIENNKLEFINSFVRILNANDRLLSSTKVRGFIQIIAINCLTYALFKNNYQVMSILLQREKIDRSSSYLNNIFPSNIKYLCDVYVNYSRNEFLRLPQDSNSKDIGYYMQSLIFQILKITWEDSERPFMESGYSYKINEELIKRYIDELSYTDLFSNNILQSKLDTKLLSKITKNYELIACLFNDYEKYIDDLGLIEKRVRGYIDYFLKQIVNMREEVLKRPITNKQNAIKNISQYLEDNDILGLRRFRELGINTEEYKPVVENPFSYSISKKNFLVWNDLNRVGQYLPLDNFYNQRIKHTIEENCIEKTLVEARRLIKTDNMILFLFKLYSNVDDFKKDFDLNAVQEKYLNFGIFGRVFNTHKSSFCFFHSQNERDYGFMCKKEDVEVLYINDPDNSVLIEENTGGGQVNIRVNKDIKLNLKEGSDMFKIKL